MPDLANLTSDQAAVLSGAVSTSSGDVPARKKANIQPAINLFDPNDIDVAYGYYPISTSGLLGQNTTYNCTGYIPVKGGLPYTRMYIPLNPTGSFQIQQGQVAYYDENKVYISGDAGTTTTFTPPANAYFMRIGVAVGLWWSLQVWQASAAGVSFWSNLQKEPPDRVSHYQMGTLRQTHMRAANLLLGTVAGQQLIINALGDSYYHGAARCITPLTNYLVSKLGDAGGGWCGFGFLTGNAGPFTTGNQPQYLNGNARPALYATRVFGNPTNAYYTRATADLASLTLLASGDAVEQDFPSTPAISAINLHYVAATAGQIRYGFAAQGSTPTNWTTLSLAGTAGTTTVVPLSLTNMVQSGTLRIEWVSGAPEISGVDLQSAAQGVRMNKIAATGSALGQWISPDATQWQTSFAALGGHLTMHNDGRNSQVAGIQASTWDTSLRTLINRVRGQTNSAFGTMAMDVLIYSPPENLTTGNTVAVASYAQVARRRAYLMRCGHINGQYAFGYSGLTSEYGYNGDVRLFETDASGGVHPLANAGGTLMVADHNKAIMPFTLY